ncbi:MAG: N-acetylmuramoyl-L-alanine amidase [Clostridia bacterium]|nr:N-acetylmuramoyl-L-alanine amidase [Clostridia bacterium]
MAKVFIGVGHGGKDPGAVANGFKEKDLNLDVADAVFDELERHGVYAMLSRIGDESDTLNDRVKECNEYSPDLAVDIHHNAGGGDGAEVFYHYKGGISKTLADNILSDIVKIGQNSRGAKIKKGADGRDYYGFIRETKAPAVIVECAFLDNKADLQIVDTEAERKTMGKAIAKGILKTLGIAYYEKEAVSAPLPEDSPKLESPTEEEEKLSLKEKILIKLAELLESFLDRLFSQL